MLAPILGPRALRRLRDRWFAAAQEHVDTLLADGGRGPVEVDGMADLAESFPLRVFPDAVGIARARAASTSCPTATTCSTPSARATTSSRRARPHVAEHAAWVNAQCAREALADDGFGAAIWAAADRGDITAEQAPLVVRSLLSAGVDTTVHGLGAVLRALATHPEAWAALRARPDLARVAFDEAVRWESPVQTFFRTAEVDVPVGDTVVPEGAKILMFLGAANRDPRHWTDPDRFDLRRDPSGHVGFGMGLHQCVGQHVARLEAAALLDRAGRPRRADRADRRADAAPQQHDACLREPTAAPAPRRVGAVGRPPTAARCERSVPRSRWTSVAVWSRSRPRPARPPGTRRGANGCGAWWAARTRAPTR